MLLFVALRIFSSTTTSVQSTDPILVDPLVGLFDTLVIWVQCNLSLHSIPARNSVVAWHRQVPVQTNFNPEKNTAWATGRVPMFLEVRWLQVNSSEIDLYINCNTCLGERVRCQLHKLVVMLILSLLKKVGIRGYLTLLHAIELNHGFKLEIEVSRKRDKTDMASLNTFPSSATFCA